MHAALLVLNWLIALFWVWRTADIHRNLPRVPNVLDEKYAQALDQPPAPMISVIVPARDEEESIEATLQSLLQIEGLTIEILAVDDRSSDATGEIMDRLAREARARQKSISVLHIAALPDGWMGKTHAMALAARQATAPWLLFTDADILFAKDSLLRAMNLATEQRADHVALFPSLTLETFGERMMLGVFQKIAAISSRPWLISDEGSREAVGIGAFNMIRAEAYRGIGGFEALRMEVVEDLRLGVEVKLHGYRQCLAYGPGLIRLRWVVGATGFVRNITKNVFSVFRFRTLPAVALCAVLAILCLEPFAAVFAGWVEIVPSAITMLMIFLLYRIFGRINRIPALYALTFPIGAALMVYAILRGIVLTLAQGGIRWRGTFYPLADLRKNVGKPIITTELRRRARG